MGTRSMTDRKAAVEGVLARTRHQSPDLEAHFAFTQSDVGSGSSIASVGSRRRSSRAKPAADVASEQSSRSRADAAKDDDLRAKGGWITPRRSANAQGTASPEHSSSETGKDGSGFMPKLGRILERKERKTTRRDQGSTVSSPGDHTLTRRVNRSVDVTALRSRPVRQKNSSLQRVERNLASLPNPSLTSVLSGLTQQSNASNESNSTITQQSYDKKLIAKRKPTKTRKQFPAKKSPSTSEPTTMASLQPSVFQYMDHTTGSEAYNDGRPQSNRSSSASSSSASSHASERDDLSSTAEENAAESPPTSPASTRRPNAEDSHEETDSDGAPDATAEPKLQASVSEATSDSEGQNDDDDGDDDAEEGDESDNDSEGEQRGKASTAANTAPKTSYVDHMALERIPPPRVPSATSSRHSDRHTRRLRRQEHALHEHILQNPQPQRDFHFTGGPSPHFPPAMPLYDPYLQTGASPVSFTPTVHNTSPVAFPPPPPPPPPHTMGYYSPAHAPPVPYSPGYENEFAVAARPPMAPSTVAQSTHTQYSPKQPPHYQVRPQGPDLTRTTVVGYELLADKLSKKSKDNRFASGEEAVVPMYRKFGNLNHRVLLHLQDEIAELEEELRYLDECIAQCSARDHAGHYQPASRRGDARYGGEMHYRRTELLGRIYLKLGQYNSALTSFNTMVKTLDPANTEDVDAYRAWMEKRTPIDHTEARFLEHKNDLLTVSEGGSASIVGGVIPRQSGAIWLPMVLALPLMVFAIVPGLLGRLVILSLTGAVVMKLITSTKDLMNMMTTREWVNCFSIYFGFMALLAALAH